MVAFDADSAVPYLTLLHCVYLLQLYSNHYGNIFVTIKWATGYSLSFLSRLIKIPTCFKQTIAVLSPYLLCVSPSVSGAKFGFNSVAEVSKTKRRDETKLWRLLRASHLFT